MKDKSKVLWAVPFLMIVCSFFLVPANAPCKQQTALGAYKTIVARDPFDPERGKNWDESFSMDSISGEELKKKYQLYGTVLSETISLAYIKTADKEKKPSKKGEKEHIRRVVIGDIIDGWRIKKIAEKGVVFASGKDSVLLQMYEGEKQERKASSPVAMQTPSAVPLQKRKQDEKNESQVPSSSRATPSQPWGRPGEGENGQGGFSLTPERRRLDIEELRKRRGGNLSESVLKRLEKFKNR